MLKRCVDVALWGKFNPQGSKPGTFFRTRVVLREHVGWMEGPEGSGPSNLPRAFQNALRITPMIEQPTMALTPSNTASDIFRIPNA